MGTPLIAIGILAMKLTDVINAAKLKRILSSFGFLQEQLEDSRSNQTCLPNSTFTQLLHENCDSSRTSSYFRLTFGAGQVVYLKCSDLNSETIDRVLLEVAEKDKGDVRLTLPFVTPRDLIRGEHDKLAASRQTRDSNNFSLDLRLFRPFIEKNSVPIQLRFLSQILDLYAKTPFPEGAYTTFAKELNLKELCLSDFLDSWVKTSQVDTYYRRSEYMVLNDYVFRKTEFVQRILQVKKDSFDAQMQTLLAEDVARQEQREVEMCLRLELMAIQQKEEADRQIGISTQNTYIYLMEDLRNLAVKIGHSSDPHRREKTLQSEQPQTVLRFAIPTDKQQERILHDRFAAQRIRGEWFSLTVSQLFDVVSYLMLNGDGSRHIIDSEWFGRVCASHLQNQTEST